MIVATVVVMLLTAVGTLIWWAMMNDWIEKDRRSRGRHHGEGRTGSPRRPPADAPRVIRRDGPPGG